MKEEYNAPQLEALGDLRDVTSGIGFNTNTDFLVGWSSDDEPGTS